MLINLSLEERLSDPPDDVEEGRGGAPGLVDGGLTSMCSNRFPPIVDEEDFHSRVPMPLSSPSSSPSSCSSFSSSSSRTYSLTSPSFSLPISPPSPSATLGSLIRSFPSLLNEKRSDSAILSQSPTLTSSSTDSNSCDQNSKIQTVTTTSAKFRPRDAVGGASHAAFLHRKLFFFGALFLIFIALPIVLSDGEFLGFLRI